MKNKERFQKRIHQGEGGCWLWDKSIAEGHKFWLDGSMVWPIYAAIKFFKEGAIFSVGHRQKVCGITQCVNPNHLRSANSLEPAIKRFHKKVKKSSSGCWHWIGNINKKHGYGSLSVCGVKLYAHRFSYELYKGKIPAGLSIDHLCRVRHCVNPDHLEAVSQKENLRRGIGVEVLRKKAKERVVCRAGHALVGDNLAWHKRKGLSPTKRCRKCDNEGYRNRKHREKENGK